MPKSPVSQICCDEVLPRINLRQESLSRRDWHAASLGSGKGVSRGQRSVGTSPGKQLISDCITPWRTANQSEALPHRVIVTNAADRELILDISLIIIKTFPCHLSVKLLTNTAVIKFPRSRCLCPGRCPRLECWPSCPEERRFSGGRTGPAASRSPSRPASTG